MDEPNIGQDPVSRSSEKLTPSRFEETKQDIGFLETEPDYIVTNRLRLFSVFDTVLILAGVALVVFSYFEDAPRPTAQVHGEPSLIDNSAAAGHYDNQWPRLEREHL